MTYKVFVQDLNLLTAWQSNMPTGRKRNRLRSIRIVSFRCHWWHFAVQAAEDLFTIVIDVERNHSGELWERVKCLHPYKCPKKTVKTVWEMKQIREYGDDMRMLKIYVDDWGIQEGKKRWKKFLHHVKWYKKSCCITVERNINTNKQNNYYNFFSYTTGVWIFTQYRDIVFVSDSFFKNQFVSTLIVNPPIYFSLKKNSVRKFQIFAATSTF